MTPDFDVIPTATGLRLKQHGVVLSEMRSQPGPTQSVFDVLATLAHILRPRAPVALLGFAGGSIMAPLRTLSSTTPVAAVDLDRSGYDLFQQQASTWAGDIQWQQTDAFDWLQHQRRRWPVIIDDLSVVLRRRVVKPDACYDTLPRLLRSKLDRHGVALCNLLRPTGMNWTEGLARFTQVFPAVRLIHLQEFENRILVAGRTLPPAGALGTEVRRTLRSLKSRQASRLRVQTLS